MFEFFFLNVFIDFFVLYNGFGYFIFVIGFELYLLLRCIVSFVGDCLVLLIIFIFIFFCGDFIKGVVFFFFFDFEKKIKQKIVLSYNNSIKYYKD